MKRIDFNYSGKTVIVADGDFPTTIVPIVVKRTK